MRGGVVTVSALCVLVLPRGMGVASAVLGDCGIGERAESRIFPCKGIIGVMSGEERIPGDMDGDTAGSMFAASMIVPLLGVLEEVLRADTSEEVRLRPVFVGDPMSICVGPVPRCSLCCCESCEACSRVRREACRCSSRTKPWNRFRRTHLPMFTMCCQKTYRRVIS